MKLLQDKGRLLYFIIGLLSGIALLSIIGATDFGPPNYGRYQISSWGTPLGKDLAGVGVFVVDTATGETKTVYSRIYGGADSGQVIKDDLRKPFHSIK
jgi:hypothetical protein